MRLKFLSLISVLLITAVVVVGLVHLKQKQEKALPVYWKAPEFQLLADDGKPFNSERLKGKIWVAEFFFASCAGICPIMNQNMAEVQKAFADNPDVLIVSITVDPKNDTPEVLREYKQNFGAMEGKWFFLTGEKEAIYRIAREGFKLAAEEVVSQEGEVSDFIHSDRFILIDRKGLIRGFYNGTDKKQVQKLIADIRKLLGE